MAVPAALEPLISSWSSYYSDHQLASVAVRYVHLASAVVGGGSAIALDRKVLGAGGAGRDTRSALLQELRGSHRVVVPALALMALSGVLMMAADLDTFLASNLFWLKIGLVGLLLGNGVLLLSAEAALERSVGGSWTRLALPAAASAALWLVIVFVGIWLTAAA
ncbi:MAG: hypothetical protein R2708_07465 [Vicinamibacterales bacterium]